MPPHRIIITLKITHFPHCLQRVKLPAHLCQSICNIGTRRYLHAESGTKISAVGSTEESEPQNMKRAHILNLISNALHSTQNMYLKTNEILELRAKLQLDEELTLDDLRDLLRVARYRMRHGEGSVEQQHSNAVTKHHKEAVRLHIERSQHADNLSLIWDEIRSRITDLPRDVLYKLVYSQWRQCQTKRITNEHHNIVSEHIKNSQHPDDIRQLCEELRHTVNLPQDALYSLVRAHIETNTRSIITDTQRQLIKEHMRQSDHRHDVPRLCNELETRIPDLPRRVLYTLVRENARAQMRSKITDEHRSIARNHILEHENSTKSELYNTLQQTLPELPRDVLYSLVHSETRRRARKRHHEQQQ